MHTQEVKLSPIEWASLGNIDDVQPIGKADADEACMSEIAAILEKYGKTERFGVALLHKHFELESDEVLVEFCDSKNRTLTTKPMKVSDIGNSVETVWTFPDKKTTRVCYRQCWKNVHGNHEYTHNDST